MDAPFILQLIVEQLKNLPIDYAHAKALLVGGAPAFEDLTDLQALPIPLQRYRAFSVFEV
jgi:hypothetical protein